MNQHHAMNQHPENTIVMSLGGSIMAPDEINIEFLKNFRKFILSFLNNHTKSNTYNPAPNRRGSPTGGGRLTPKTYRFVIVAGGGKIARNYQHAASEIVRVSNEDKDWLGIHATRINAHLLRTIFRDKAYPVVLDGPSKPIKTGWLIVIASGWRPGCSTDYDTVLLAKRFKSKTFINAGKFPYVYDKDFKKYPDAVPIKDITWKEYRKLIPSIWSPGLPSPIDPVAAREAERSKLTAIILQGDDLKNMKRAIEGKPFEGTIIHP